MILSEKHLQILDNAEILFAEKGYDGTTVRDIADSAGVNLAMISYYFGSKEKLLETLFKTRMTATLARLEDIAANASLTLKQKTEILIDEYVNRVMQKQAFYKVLLLEQVTNKNMEVIKLLKGFKIKYAKLITDMITEGESSKKKKKEVDVIMLMTTMTGTVMQMLVNKDYYREFNNYKKMQEAAFDEILKTNMKAHIKHVFKATLGYE